MTNKIVLVASLLILLTSCSQIQKSYVNNDVVFQVLEVSDFKTLLEEDVQLIDVRTPKEYMSGHIKNAININFYEDDFMDQLKQLNTRNKTLIYCAKGVRSNKAMKKMINKGSFVLVYDLKGGINAWKQKKLLTRV